MNLALFDFDGTITTRETFVDFVRHAVTPVQFRRGRRQLWPAYLGYRLGLVSSVAMRARVVNVAFSGMPEAALAAAGERFARDFLPTVLRPEAIERLDWHAGRGDRVVVVSGGLDAYLSPWCAARGFALHCSRLQACDGVLTGRYDGAQCVAAEKARQVREAFDLASFAAVYAYGDTEEDRAMLDLAQHRVFRGKPLPARSASAAR